MNKINGLSNEEINLSRKKHGTNKLTGYKKTTILSLLFESLSDPIVRILLPIISSGSNLQSKSSLWKTAIVLNKNFKIIRLRSRYRFPLRT